jgi:hypothetical protein
VDLNLETLKSEILAYLDASGFAIFHSNPGGLEGLPMVIWNTEKYPDYQMFLETAKRVNANLVLFATSEFTVEELESVTEEMEGCDFSRDERRDLESRLKEMRGYEGVTCSLEIAFDHQSRFYVYEVRPDWYEDFLSIGDEIDAHTPTAGDDEENGSLGGYFSNN